MKRYDVLIVGSGHGGAQAAIGLRQSKFGGSIGLVSREADPPYERPPLSKEYLAGDKPFERILLRPAAFWAERAIDLLPGREVVLIDPIARIAVCREGETIAYGQLVWAAGGSPRRLTCGGGDLQGIHSIRTREDVDALRSELGASRRILVIGGGYIGLEAAAVLTRLGKEVVLLEALERVLARVAGEPLSRFYEAEHRSRGVDIRLGARIDCIEGQGGRVAGVRLADRGFIEGDLAIVGIGIAPAVEPLFAAGAATGDGVHVDPLCRTSLPGVYAIGDCAAHENRYAGGARLRLESVQNATDQAMAVARTLAGEPCEYDALPWFWSNQYDLRLQTVGISAGYDDLVVRGSLEARSFSIVYLRAGRVIALDCVNATRDYAQGRRLIEQGKPVDKALLASASTTLKELAG